MRGGVSERGTLGSVDTSSAGDRVPRDVGGQLGRPQLGGSPNERRGSAGISPAGRVSQGTLGVTWDIPSWGRSPKGHRGSAGT